jgi:alpha-L-arabinofuranosidase
VIAPIMTEPGGPAWKQTTFFPFAVTSRLAVGASLEVRLESPTYATEAYGEVPVLDAVATHDPETGAVALFLVNRDQSEAHEVSVDISAVSGLTVIESVSLWDEDRNAKNTLEDPERVGLKTNDSAVIDGGRLTVTLPPVSWTAISLSAAVNA